MTASEKIKILKEEIEKIEEKYCDNCHEWYCDDCWMKIDEAEENDTCEY